MQYIILSVSIYFSIKFHFILLKFANPEIIVETCANKPTLTIDIFISRLK